MRLDERGKACPLPMLEAKKELERSAPGTVVEVLVDNEIAVQNLRKMAGHKGLEVTSEKTVEGEFLVCITAGETAAAQETEKVQEEPVSCYPDSRKKGVVVVISSREMGQGDPVLGRLLMKSYLYALTQQEELPQTMLFYNGGAYITCEESDSLEDLKLLESQGVEILTCGTCLNHYGIGDKLKVGGVSNMYEIAEKMAGAGLIVRP